MSGNQDADKVSAALISVINKLVLVIVVLMIALIAIPIVFCYSNQADKPENVFQREMTKKEDEKK